MRQTDRRIRALLNAFYPSSLVAGHSGRTRRCLTGLTATHVNLFECRGPEFGAAVVVVLGAVGDSFILIRASALSTDFDVRSATDRRRTNTAAALGPSGSPRPRAGGRAGAGGRRPGGPRVTRARRTLGGKPSVVDRRLCPANENEQLVVVMDAFEIKSRV